MFQGPRDLMTQTQQGEARWGGAREGKGRGGKKSGEMQVRGEERQGMK